MLSKYLHTNKLSWNLSTTNKASGLMSKARQTWKVDDVGGWWFDAFMWVPIIHDNAVTSSALWNTNSDRFLRRVQREQTNKELTLKKAQEPVSGFEVTDPGNSMQYQSVPNPYYSGWFHHRILGRYRHLFVRHALACHLAKSSPRLYLLAIVVMTPLFWDGGYQVSWCVTEAQP